MANVFEGRRTFMHPVLRWLEVLTYKLIGVREDVEQRWTQYTASLLASAFSASCWSTRCSGCRPTAVQSAGFQRRNVTPGPGVQYRRQLHHQHQLAGLLPARRR